MYYRNYQFFLCCLIFCVACRPAPNQTAHQLLNPGPLAEELLLNDPQEGYFDKVQASDIKLQMHPMAFDTLLGKGLYKMWLKSQIKTWPKGARKRCDRLLHKAIATVESKFPGLLPATIYMVLQKNKPYGEHIYFTRQNAIFVPLASAENASDQDLYTVFLHELFHLISREKAAFRPQLYAIANFVPTPAHLAQDSLEKLAVLVNPDAPNMDYVLRRDSQLYLPVLFANPSSTDFAEAINYAYFKLDFLANKVAVSSANQSLDSVGIISSKRLPEHRIIEASEANSNYLIHPEEILAEHFALLFTADPEELLYPQELVQLEALLTSMSK